MHRIRRLNANALKTQRTQSVGSHCVNNITTTANAIWELLKGTEPVEHRLSQEQCVIPNG